MYKINESMFVASVEMLFCAMRALVQWNIFVVLWNVQLLEIIDTYNVAQ